MDAPLVFDVVPAQAPVDHATLRKNIRECESMNDCIDCYDSPAYQQVLRVLRVSQGTNDGNIWSKEWAIRMRNARPGDIELNECRKSALLLVYRICNLWRDPDFTDVTAQTLVDDFKGHRFTNILQLTLPMDRAQCLYSMSYSGNNRFGMHWAAEAHADELVSPDSMETWGQIIEAAGGFFSMNKRYLWLLELEGLGLGSSPAFQSWTTPRRIPD